MTTRGRLAADSHRAWMKSSSASVDDEPAGRLRRENRDQTGPDRIGRRGLSTTDRRAPRTSVRHDSALSIVFISYGRRRAAAMNTSHGAGLPVADDQSWTLVSGQRLAVVRDQCVLYYCRDAPGRSWSRNDVDGTVWYKLLMDLLDALVYWACIALVFSVFLRKI